MAQRMSTNHLLFLLSLSFIFTLDQILAHTDYRLTIIKPGWGVNFHRDGHLIIDGGTAFFTHTWAAEWPKIEYKPMMPFNCSLAYYWGRRCAAVNVYIRETNNLVYENLASTEKILNEAKMLLSANGRTRRQADMDYLNDAYDVIPTFEIGNMYADITGTPSRKTLKSLKTHLQLVGSAIQANIDGIKQFESNLESFSKLTNKRIDCLEEAGNVTNHRLQMLNKEILDFYTKTELILANETLRLKYVWFIDTNVIAKVIPTVANYQRASLAAHQAAKLWEAGLVRLAGGYLSPHLVPVHAIKPVIQHIREVVLKQPAYVDLQLASDSPGYFYNLKKVTYSFGFTGRNQTSTLFITMKFPLTRVGSSFPVYRLDIYPVPTTAGIRAKGNHRLGFTLLQNLPDFIAVSENQETYVEMNKNLFLSCTGIPDARICGSGMPAIKKRRSGQLSCAFALFLENTQQIFKQCDFRYVNTDQWKPYGSAVQLTADSTFLMHASQRGPKDVWTLSCPLSTQTPQTPVEPCNMCRIEVPCSCSMSASDFYLPSRYTGCTVSTEGVSYIYHLNSVMIKSLFPDSAEAKYLSYKNFSKLQNPSFEMPDIKFEVEDNFTSYVDISNALSARLNKTLQRAAKDLKSYIIKEDAALNRTRNFTDQVVDRAGSITDAIQSVFDGIFGGSVFAFLSTLLTPYGILLVACIVNMLEFVPNFIADMNRCRQRRQERISYSLRRKMNGKTYVSLPMNTYESSD